MTHHVAWLEGPADTCASTTRWPLMVTISLRRSTEGSTGLSSSLALRVTTASLSWRCEKQSVNSTDGESNLHRQLKLFHEA